MAKDYTPPQLGFYRPHKRVQFTGELVNPVTGEVTRPPSMTKQSFVEECDINNILREYSASGQLRHISARAEQGMYADLPDQADFQTALNIVLEGQAAFASLPSKVRNRFNNDPAEFLEFMADPANQEEAIRLGLATDSRPAPAPASSSSSTSSTQNGASSSSSSGPPRTNTGGEGEPPLA